MVDEVHPQVLSQFYVRSRFNETTSQPAVPQYSCVVSESAKTENQRNKDKKREDRAQESSPPITLRDTIFPQKSPPFTTSTVRGTIMLLSARCQLHSVQLFFLSCVRERCMLDESLEEN